MLAQIAEKFVRYNKLKLQFRDSGLRFLEMSITPITNENAPILKTTIVVARKSIPTLLHEFQKNSVNTMWVELDFEYSSGLRFLENLATPITNENATIPIARRTIQSLLPRIARRRKMVRYKARIQRFIRAVIPGNVDDTNN